MLNGTKIPIFPFIVLIVVNIENQQLKFPAVVIDVTVEGTVSQILLLRPWFLFYLTYKIIFTLFFKCFPIFAI